MSHGSANRGRQRPLIELSQISKRFGGTVALSDIDWSIDAGEVHCLVGENGSGKSTLIKILTGVHPPDPGGAITIDEVTYASLTPHRAKSLGVQVIFQDLSLFPNLTVMENIAIDMELSAPVLPPPRRAMREAAIASLARLGATLSLDAPVGALSVAQRQIVAICRGLAGKARVLFMDEPTASLTRREVVKLLETVRRLKSLGISVVFVSHRLEEIIEVAERVTVLRDGRKVGTFASNEVNDHRLAELMTGESITHKLMTQHVARDGDVFEVMGAARAGEFRDISFKLRQGEILGLIGLLGSGRTELALALFGMSRLQSGRIRLGDSYLDLRSNQDAVAAGIAYVSEDRLTLGLNLKQPISENISITVLDRLKSALRLVPSALRAKLAGEWVARLGIKASNVEAAVQTLSGGNQQRVVLAKWLATHPKVLILDSPTVGVDIRNKQGIYEVIRSLAAQGVAILLISDEVPEVYYNSDRILHMRNGEIVGEYAPGVATEAALAEALYA